MTGSKSGSANVAAHSGDVPLADQNPSDLRAGETRAAFPGAMCPDTATASFAHPAMIDRLWMPA
jgi:hypothetical protein